MWQRETADGERFKRRTLGVQRRLAGLVLRHLVHLVLLAFPSPCRTPRFVFGTFTCGAHVDGVVVAVSPLTNPF